MPQAAIPLNKQTVAVGLTVRKVQVLQVVPETGKAIVSDKLNFYTQVPYTVQPGMGRLPREGDMWIIDRSLGNWTFAKYLATSNQDFATMVGPVVISDNLRVEGTATMSDLGVEGDASIGDDLGIGGDLNVEGKSLFEDDATFQEDVTVEGTLHAQGGVDFDGDLHVEGSLTVDLVSSLKGDAYVDGVATVNNILNTYGPIMVKPLTGGGATTSAIQTSLVGDTYPRGVIRRDGQIQFGSGAAGPDCVIERTGAGTLSTNSEWDALNFPSGGWNNHTPAWTTSTGLHTPAFGNAGVFFTWTRVARLIICQFEFIMGSSTFYNGGGTTDNWRWSLPVNSAGTYSCVGFADAQNATDHRVTCRVTLPTNNTFSLDVCSGAVDGVALDNGGLVDTQTPWAWGNTANYVMRGSFQYQAALGH